MTLDSLAARQATETSTDDVASATTPSAPTVTTPIPNPRDEDAFSCWYSSSAYSSILTSINNAASAIPWTSDQFFPTFISSDCCWGYAPPASTTTLCDGYPRVLSVPEIVYNVTMYTTLYN